MTHRVFLLISLMAMIGCNKPPVTEWHCDLALADGNGNNICFDRTDGHGKRIPFTKSDQIVVAEQFAMGGRK